MALIFAPRVLETSTTTGTGTLTLAGAVTGYQAFSAVCANGDRVYYYIEAVDASGVPAGDWETGFGTCIGGTLVRDEIKYSSNSNSAVSFAAGTKRVALTVISQWFQAPINAVNFTAFV